MNKVDYIQACKNMSVNQLLEQLYSAESAVCKVWSCSNEISSIEQDKNVAKGHYIADKSSILLYLIPSVITGVISLILMYFAYQTRNYSRLTLPQIMLFPALFAFVGFFLGMLGSWSSAKQIKKQLSQYDLAIKTAEDTLESAKIELHKSLLIASWICPKECFNPVHMRKYISFFEDGRADNLREAQNLFDAYIHRCRMEQSAREQQITLQRTLAVARAAEEAAKKAEASALQAKQTAERTQYYYR